MKKHKILLIMLVAILAIGAGLPFIDSGGNPYANVGDTITLRADYRIPDEIGWDTTKMYVSDTSADMGDAEDRYVFCVEPKKRCPISPGETATFTINNDWGPEQTSGWRHDVRKMLWYSPGQGGMNTIRDYYVSMGFDDNDSRYALAHMTLARLFGNADWQWGRESWTSASNKLWAKVQTLPEPPDNFRAYRIHEGGDYQDFVGAYYEEKGSLQLKKVSQNSRTNNLSAYSLKGTKYGVYKSHEDADKNQNPVDTLVTDANGVSNEISLTKGWYYLKELPPAPTGFALDKSVHSKWVGVGADATITVSDPPLYGTLNVYKAFADNEEEWAEFGSKYYNRKGAVYKAYNTKADAEAKNGKVAKDKDGKDIVFTIKADGTSNETYTVFADTYYVKETTTPTNLKEDQTVHAVKVTFGENKPLKTAESVDRLIPGKLTLIKSSAIPDTTNGNDCYDLKGATYGIYTKKANADAATPENPGKPLDTLVTKSDGTTNTVTLFAGTYYLKEIAPAKNYAVNEETIEVEVVPLKTETAEPTTVKTKDKPQSDPVQILLQKKDAKTINGKKQGAGTLGGAVFEIKYYDGHYTTLDKIKESGKEPLRKWKFKTDEDGYILFGEESLFVSGDKFYHDSLGANVLPIGTVTIEEITPPTGYLRDTKVHVRTYESDGYYESVFTYNDADKDNPIIGEQSIRGDFTGVKIDEDMQRLAGVPFLITSKTTGESHVVITDANGEFDSSSKWAKHSHNTNANDYILKDGKVQYDENGNVDTSKMDALNGLWFNGQNNDKTGAPVDDKDGALPYDKYKFQELRCEANAGYNLVSFEGTIYRPSTDFLVDLGTVTDGKPEFKTTALDQKTKEHIANAAEKVTIIDTVKYDGLQTGKTYTVKGTLMDKETGEPLLIDGKTVTAEKEFTAKSKNGEVEMAFTFNGVSMKGKSTVVFEEVYDDEGLVGVHADINDEDQTVGFPEIGTQAAFVEEGKLTDTVSYKGLVPDEEYELTATLVDKDGNEIDGAGSVKFTAESEDGQIEVPIETSAKGTAVVYETLKWDGKVIAEHKDVTDENQTIVIPAIGTTAALTGVNTITDVVEYKDLTPGIEYTMRATLMDKETGEAIEGCEPVETKFTPEEANGTVEVELDATAAQGKITVVFEECLIDNTIEPAEGEEPEVDETLIASHKDINDDNQTVAVPKIGTKASFIKLDNIYDRVNFENLVAGKEYTMKATLIDKETGEELGKGERTFKAELPDGYVDVEIVGKDIAGKTVVVYEECYVDDMLVAEHKDIEDKDQTVDVPGIGTKAAFIELNKVVDTVEYKNLTVGEEYTLKAVLMDKETGKAIKGTETEMKFKPEKSEGSVDVAIKAEGVEGKTIVAFEELYLGEDLIAQHKDIEDKDQTVEVPEIKTKASINDSKKVTDTVSYKNLTPGKEYTMKATLMTKDGKETGVKAEMKFKPEKKDGKVDVTMDASKLEPGTYVVFEECLLDGKVVAVHKELQDKDQTVVIPQPNNPQTGDNSLITLAIVIALCGLAIAGGAAWMRKRDDE